MSWYEDHQLFIVNSNEAASSGFTVFRCTKELTGPIKRSDLRSLGRAFSESMALGDNKATDFDAFLAYLINITVGSGSKIYRFVNSQGLVINQEFVAGSAPMCTWSDEPLNSPFYNLPGIKHPVVAEKEALERRVSDLLAEISPLKFEVHRNKDDKKALEKINSDLTARNSILEGDVQRVKDLEKQVSDLTLKLKECCGAGGGSADKQPFNSGSTVPNNWVPYENLDVLNIPRNTSLEIIKAPGAMKFVEDNTTNVRACHFYGGLYLAAVKVEELIPNKDEARFDPNFWGLYHNAGKHYAARKLFKSEM